MIELQDVVKTYAAGLATPFTAVAGVSLRIPAGKLTVLKGPSGSGKTTLLTLIGCMARPTSGRIHLHGLAADALPHLAPAEALVRDNPPFDVCLADYRLPGDRDGLSVIATLAALPGAPRAFCLVTGDMAAEVLAAADAARVPIIHKPLHPARLRALLNHLAAGARREVA